MAVDSSRSESDSRGEILRLCERIPSLSAYEAALAYRDAVRLEIPLLRDAMPDKRSRHEYEVYASTYLRPPPRRCFTDHNFAQKLMPTVELIRSPEVHTVLDAACGLGFESVFLALQGKPVIANDCSERAFKCLRIRKDLYREILGDRLRLETYLSNIMRADAALGRYDVTYVQEAISHIHPAEDFIRLAAERYLNPGGRLVLCDSNHWNPVTRIRVSRWLWKTRRTLRYYVNELTDPRTGEKFSMAQERLFSPVKIGKMMRSAQLTVEAVAMNCFVLPWMIRESGRGWGVAVDRLLARTPGLRLVGGFYTVIGRKE